PASYGQQPAPYGGDQPGFYMGRPLANWPVRAAGYIIDYLIFFIPGLVAILLSSATGQGEAQSAGVGVVIFLLWLVGVGIWVYNRCFLAGRTGQSWGKQVMNTRLLRMSDGQPIGAGQAFVRDLAHIIDSLICYIGWLFPLWDARRQTIADKIMSTVVVAER
ncbi:MAG TPA: RDD family protein, partial [Actinomycetota bacterium]|nr:RDD family protein [Actinomycetota bacterium]